MEPISGYTHQHSPLDRALHGRGACAAQHTSRREIDMAIGAYMALCRCSETQARSSIIDVARSARVGLGAASQSLLAALSDDTGVEPAAALLHWTAQLGSSSGD